MLEVDDLGLDLLAGGEEVVDRLRATHVDVRPGVGVGIGRRRGNPGKVIRLRNAIGNRKPIYDAGLGVADLDAIDPNEARALLRR